MPNYRQWLLAQLRTVNQIDVDPAPQIEQLDGLRSIIDESERRAAVAGVPAAVQACKVRQGPLSPIAARKVLAACLAAVPDTTSPPSDEVPLSIQQAAKRFNIAVRTLYALCADGSLPHARIGTGRGTIRIKPVDLNRLVSNGSSKTGLLD